MSTERTVRPAEGGIDMTMRPASQDMTMRPASQDMTMRPASQDITMRPASQDMTMRGVSNAVSGNGTVRGDGGIGHDDDVSDNSFVLKGVGYRNIQSLSNNSGEAQVFLVERDGEKYVLKIYYPSFDVNKKILQRVYNFDFEMIVKVYDFGKTYVDGKHRYYELMEYLQGGTMSDYHLNGAFDKFRRIALQGAAAFKHGRNVSHACRIKITHIKFGQRTALEEHILHGRHL